jgi:hypothetical protein
LRLLGRSGEKLKRSCAVPALCEPRCSCHNPRNVRKAGRSENLVETGGDVLFSRVRRLGGNQECEYDVSATPHDTLNDIKGAHRSWRSWSITPLISGTLLYAR